MHFIVMRLRPHCEGCQAWRGHLPAEPDVTICRQLVNWTVAHVDTGRLVAATGLTLCVLRQGFGFYMKNRLVALIQ